MATSNGTWKTELKTDYDLIKEYANIETVNTSRAPFLAYNDYYFSNLQYFNVSIDSSVLD
jgi:hypothetical protein